MANWRRLIPFIRKTEGGLSRDPDDPAAKQPAPCPHNGQLGWHTNKGITYQTFISNTSLGYDGTCENFFSMPDDIWEKIYKAKIWDAWQLDKMRSQALADIIVDWSFNSGAAGAYKQIRNVMNEKYGMDLPASYSADAVERIRKKINSISWIRELDIRKDLLNQRIQFYQSLNQPKFIDGWTNRVEDLKQETASTVTISMISKLLIGLTTVGAIITGAVIIFRKSKQH